MMPVTRDEHVGGLILGDSLGLFFRWESGKGKEGERTLFVVGSEWQFPLRPREENRKRESGSEQKMLRKRGRCSMGGVFNVLDKSQLSRSRGIAAIFHISRMVADDCWIVYNKDDSH